MSDNDDVKAIQAQIESTEKHRQRLVSENDELINRLKAREEDLKKAILAGAETGKLETEISGLQVNLKGHRTAIIAVEAQLLMERGVFKAKKRAVALEDAEKLSDVIKQQAGVIYDTLTSAREEIARLRANNDEYKRLLGAVGVTHAARDYALVNRLWSDSTDLEKQLKYFQQQMKLFKRGG